MIDLIEYPDRDMMLLDLADVLASELADLLHRNEAVSFCVPGGTTPGPIFDVLSAQALDWHRVTVFLSDERWLAGDNPRSNTKLVRERLLTGAAAVADFAPLYVDAATPEDALGALSAGLKPHLPISLLLLGMGEDMHTASLFPGADRLHDALTDADAILMPMRAPGAPEVRITLTAAALSSAISTHIVITGAAKRAALERAQNLPVADAPIRAVLPGAIVHWAP